MIKILYVLNDFKNGGTESFVMNYYRKLDRQKFSADFMILSGNDLYYADEVEANGDKVIHISNDNKKKYFININKIRVFLKKHSYDIVHINSCSLKFMAQVAFAAKTSCSAKVIGHAHSIGEPDNSWKYRFASKIFRKIIDKNIDFAMACSSDSAEMKFFPSRIQSESYEMIPNAVDTSIYKFSEENRKKIRERYGIIDEAVVMGIVGRLDKWKNQSFLLDVLYRVLEKKLAYLVMVGDGDLREVLKKKSEMLGISNYVIFTGNIHDVFAFYSAMDFFCLPSYSEGFPFVIVKAQANGLKCIVSSDLTPETNISGTVLYLNRFDADLWSDKITTGSVDRIGEIDVKKVVELFDINNAVRKLESTYEKLLR